MPLSFRRAAIGSTNPAKVEAVRGYGAAVRFVEGTYSEAAVVAQWKTLFADYGAV